MELPCTATEIEERIDINLLPLSRYEFNLWNNGLTVGIMRAEAHAAVTNAVIPYRLTGCSGSSVHLLWRRMLPDSICRWLFDKQPVWLWRKTQWWPLVSQDLFPHSAVCGFPAALSLHTLTFLKVGVRGVCVPVRVCTTFFWMILLLPHWAGWFTCFINLWKNPCTYTLTELKYMILPHLRAHSHDFFCFWHYFNYMLT